MAKTIKDMAKEALNSKFALIESAWKRKANIVMDGPNITPVSGNNDFMSKESDETVSIRDAHVVINSYTPTRLYDFYDVCKISKQALFFLKGVVSIKEASSLTVSDQFNDSKSFIYYGPHTTTCEALRKDFEKRVSKAIKKANCINQ